MAKRRKQPAPRSIPWVPPAVPAVVPLPAVDPERKRVLSGLRDLARDVSGSLRYHPDRQVRRALALLVAASVAAAVACDTSEPVPPIDPISIERPAQMGNLGFPGTPGTYELRKDSVQVDTGGNYYLYWLDPARSGDAIFARGSDMRLVEDDKSFLEVGSDLRPVLHLHTEEKISMVDPSTTQPVASATPGTSVQSGGGFYPGLGLWYPFFIPGGMGRTVIVDNDRGVEADRTARRSPAYYSPPSGDVDPGGTVSGGNRTTTMPKSSPGFTLGAGARGVSGQSGGTGSGAAATSKGGTGVGTPRSSGFSGGTGAGSAASGKGAAA